jgi:1-acyl-sn-glycerol-3-phosphate acyltransferase
MRVPESVEAYVTRQPSYAWKRRLIRLAIRTIGFHVLANVKVYGVENVPTTGPTIIMMNHISAIDPVVVMGAVTQRFVVPMSKIENLSNPLLAPFIDWWGAYTINRDEVDRKALINSIALIQSGQLILIAPEGTRQRDGLIQPKDGLAYIATKANAVIVPTALSGAQHFSRSIKKLQRAPVSVTFGRAFRFRTEGAGRVSRDALAAMSEEAMYQLASTLPDPALRGVYSDLTKATTNHLEFIA